MFKKLRALWAARKVVNQMGDVKRGWKTLGFWVTLLGNMTALVTALNGIIPATTAAIVSGAITALYTVLRGAQKSEEAGVREWYKTSEFYMAVGSQLGTVLLTLQQNGVNAAWVATSSTILSGVLAISRDLSHKQPETPKP